MLGRRWVTVWALLPPPEIVRVLRSAAEGEVDGGDGGTSWM